MERREVCQGKGRTMPRRYRKGSGTSQGGGGYGMGYDDLGTEEGNCCKGAKEERADIRSGKGKSVKEKREQTE